MDRFESMSVFQAVVDQGSLSAAGRRLGMPLATVSRKLSELEAHLQARLLNRSTRKLTLTDAGREYALSCRRILDDVDEAERTASGEYNAPRGELVVTAPIVFGRLHVLPVVVAFLQAYPEVDVRLVLGDRVLDLIEEHVDLAVRVGELPDSRLTATRVGVTRRVVCATPRYLDRHGRPVVPADLARHRCVTFDAPSAIGGWQFTVDGRPQAVAIRSRLTVNTAEAAIEAALADVGITRVLCYQVEDARRAGHLEFVLKDFETVPAPISLVHGGQRRVPLKLRAFLDFAAPRLRERLLQIA